LRDLDILGLCSRSAGVEEMTDEERQRVQRLAREAAAEYSYGDSTTNPGRILEVRKARRGERQYV